MEGAGKLLSLSSTSHREREMEPLEQEVNRRLTVVQQPSAALPVRRSEDLRQQLAAQLMAKSDSDSEVQIRICRQDNRHFNAYGRWRDATYRCDSATNLVTDVVIGTMIQRHLPVLLLLPNIR